MLARHGIVEPPAVVRGGAARDVVVRSHEPAHLHRRIGRPAPHAVPHVVDDDPGVPGEHEGEPVAHVGVVDAVRRRDRHRGPERDRRRLGDVVHQQRGLGWIPRAEHVAPAGEIRHGGRMNPLRHEGTVAECRPAGVGEPVDVEPRVGPELGAEDEHRTVVAHLHVAHGADRGQHHRIRQGGRTRGVERPDLHDVARRAVAPGRAPGAGVGPGTVNPEVRGIPVGDIVTTALYLEGVAGRRTGARVRAAAAGGKHHQQAQRRPAAHATRPPHQDAPPCSCMVASGSADAP